MAVPEFFDGAIDGYGDGGVKGEAGTGVTSHDASL